MALEYVELAHANTPSYSKIINELQKAISPTTSLENALQGMEKATKTEKTQQKTTQTTQTTRRSYASVAATANPSPPRVSNNPPTISTSPMALIAASSTAFATAKLKSLKTKAVTKNPNQFVLITKKNESLPNFSPVAVRNAVNKALKTAGKAKGPVVGAVARSAAGNVVLTTIPPYNAEMLANSQSLWESVFSKFPIQNS